MRRQWFRWWGLVGLSGAVAVGLISHAASTVSASSPRHREVSFTYQVRLAQLPQGAGAVDVWVPLAKTNHDQQVLSRRIHTTIPYLVTQDPDYGNDILHLRLQPPLPEAVEVAIDYQVRLGPGAETASDVTVPDRDIQRDLQSQGLLIIDGEVRARAARATAGRATVVERARGIYDAVIRQVVYDKNVPGWGRGDTRRVCLLGKGNCTDFHSLFISMARASRIPARFKIGVVVPQEPSGAIPGYHCWAEFYEEGRGWIPVDASEAWKHPELQEYYFGAHDPNRLLISQGRDIRLVPSPRRDEPVNIFFYPYVEIDGRAFDRVETQLTFRELNQEAML